VSPESGVAAFDDFVSALDYPIFVVTTRSPISGDQAGCLVGFATQTSITPRRFLIGISRKNFTYRIACNATHLAVHLVPKTDAETARLFGGTTGDDIDKFERCRWHAGPEMMPILADSPAWFVGAIAERLDIGDHMGYLIEPIGGSVTGPTPEWVTFSDIRDLNPGHDA